MPETPDNLAREGAGSPPAVAGEVVSTADLVPGTVSVRQAARQLGVSERTIRRRIQDELLPALKHETEHGYEWRVPVAAITAQGNGASTLRADPLDGKPVQGGSTPLQPAAELLRVLDLVERLHDEQKQEIEQLRRDNQQLAGQVGFLQAKLQDAEEQIRLLMAPKDEEPATPPDPGTRPSLWTWLRQRFGPGGVNDAD